MRIVSRAEWGARSPKGVHRIATPTPRLWVHHTATEQHGAAGVRAIQRYHMDNRGWLDIAYSFLIDDDGTVYEGRGTAVAGGHTAGDNSTSHAACLMGNFENRAPTKAAVASLVELARYGQQKRWWAPTLGGHRDAPGASTACPGRHLYAVLPTIRSRITSTSSPQEDDMTPEQERRFDIMYDRVLRIERGITPKGDTLGSYKDSEVPDDRRLGHLIAHQLTDDSDGSRTVHDRAKRALEHARAAEAKLDLLTAGTGDGLDPEIIAAAVVDALPPELAQQVVAEIGTRLSEDEAS